MWSGLCPRLALDRYKMTVQARGLGERRLAQFVAYVRIASEVMPQSACRGRERR